MLSVSFLIAEMRREWGGCAGNIAYNLKLLGGEPVVMATVGQDRPNLSSSGSRSAASTSPLKACASSPAPTPRRPSSSPISTTTRSPPSIPGAMNASHRNRVSDVAGIALGIVAPDGREGMRSHVHDFAAADIPFIFDPGQGLPLFSGSELLDMVDRADYLALNDYEGGLLAERTGLSIEAMATRVEALIVTHGGEGSSIYSGGTKLDIPAVEPAAVVDPTGCGDAYRAGLLYGIGQGWDWRRSGRLASLLGSLKIAARGGQNHALSRDAVAELYQRRFGEALF